VITVECDTPIMTMTSDDLAGLRAAREAQRATVADITSAEAELPDPIGHTVPRLFTPPLVTGPPGECGCGCAHTSSTTYGFGVARLAEGLGTPLDPWERWLVIHAGELGADGLPRFRHVLVMVARQNGKTWLLTVLCLYWLFVERVWLIVSMSTNLDYAVEAWEAGVDIVLAAEALAEDLPPTRNRGVRRANGQQSLTLAKPRGVDKRRRWKVAASNRRGGRSLSIDRLVIDELREHYSWEAWNASVPATNARPGSQIFCITNAGDARSIVLNSRVEAALEGADVASFIAMWSMPKDWVRRIHSATDEELLAGLCVSNPNLGRRIRPEVLLGDARTAVAAGGEELAQFLTEIGCIYVAARQPAVDESKWLDLVERHDLAAAEAFALPPALCADVAPDGLHASVLAARVLLDGRVACDVVASWSGADCTRILRRELPIITRRVRPWAVGWFPDGGAAAVAATLAKRQGWPPRGIELRELTGERAGACMGLADLVRNGGLVHPGDELLNMHVTKAERLEQGDRWVFTRDLGHCSAAYALAGAAHLALQAPPALPALAAV